MGKTLSARAQQVQEVLAGLGFDCPIRELSQSTRSAAEAALAVGCEIAQIAKSLVLKGRKSERPFLVIASGANRVNTNKVRDQVGEAVQMADADFVRRVTGFAIGGIPPIGHRQPLPTFIDQDLLGCDHLWAAAGTPRALFRLTPQDLTGMTGGKVIDLA